MKNEVPYSNARERLAELMDQATSDREPITITRQGKEPVVLIAASEYDSMRETAYLLRSPENARRLLEALVDARSGNNLETVSVDDLRKELGG